MADNDSRIAELLARLQAEPSSRVFVQLAEEYRRGGKLDEALKVLEAGLKRQPNYLSAKIALGRCRLETGEVDVAADIFHEVLRRDATNLVANKLLVQAYLEAGNLGKAREQLNLYGILNDRDPDIEDLRLQIEGGGKPKGRKQGPLGQESEGADASPFLETVVPEPEIDAESEIEAEPEMEAESESKLRSDLQSESVRADEGEVPSRAQVPAQAFAGEKDVFAGLFQAEDQERYLNGLGAEGLFGGVSGAIPALETAASTGVVGRAFELEHALDPAPEPVPEPAPEPVPAPAADSLVEAVFVPNAAAESASAPVSMEGDLFGSGGADRPLPGIAQGDDDPVFHLPPVASGTTSVRAPEADSHSMAEREPEAPKIVPDGVLDTAQRGVEDVAATMIMPQLSPELFEPAPGAEQGGTTAREAEQEPPATATLGQLYLQQGHREEARKIFHRVLDREPAHPVALAALQAMDQKPAVVEAPAAPPVVTPAAPPPSAPGVLPPPERPVVAVGPGWLTAEGILAAEDLSAVKGLTARKALLLKNYLHRLRAGGQEA